MRTEPSRTANAIGDGGTLWSEQILVTKLKVSYKCEMWGL